jgi:hypothetical protein
VEVPGVQADMTCLNSGCSIYIAAADTGAGAADVLYGTGLSSAVAGVSSVGGAGVRLHGLICHHGSRTGCQVNH